MENLTANIGKAVPRKLGGRDYLVAPITMLVPGVLPGSQGPIFYPEDEVEKWPGLWNHVPLVVYHPVKNGQHVSARDAEVLDQSGVGLVLGDAYANGKRVAEGWFDVEAVRKADYGLSPGDRILPRLQSGKPIEISTGLDLDKEEAPAGATFNGQGYYAVARNFRPDHLAILPDAKGACSNADGCGVNVNARMCWGKPCPTDEAPATFSDHVDDAAKMTPGQLKKTFAKVDKAHREAMDEEWAKQGSSVGAGDLFKAAGEHSKLGQLSKQRSALKYHAERNGISLNEESWVEDLKLFLNDLPSEGIDPDKACQILKDGAIKGEPLTEAQHGMFGAACGKAANAGFETFLNCGGEGGSHGPCSGSGGSFRPAHERQQDMAKEAFQKGSKVEGMPHLRTLTVKQHKALKDKHDLTDSESFGAGFGGEGTYEVSKTSSGIITVRKKVANQQGDNMGRKDMIQYLVTNCECWKGKGDKALLDKFDDAKLAKLVGNTKVILVVNQIRNKKGANAGAGEGEAVAGVPWVELASLLGVDLNPADDPIAFSAALKDKLDEIVSKLGGAPAAGGDVTMGDPMEPDADDQVAMASTQAAGSAEVGQATTKSASVTPEKTGNRSSQAWLRNAPPEVRSAVQNAMRIEKQTKLGIIQRLVGNIADNGQRQKAGAKLMAKSLDDLQEMLSFLPAATQPAVNQELPNFAFAGAAGAGNPGGFVDNAGDGENREVLDLDAARQTWEEEDRQRRRA